MGKRTIRVRRTFTPQFKKDAVRLMEQSREFPIGQLCRVLGVSRSGFYAWRRRPRSERDRQNTILVDRIRAVHRESRGIYGSPRVYRALRSAGYAIGKHRVARL